MNSGFFTYSDQKNGGIAKYLDLKLFRKLIEFIELKI